MMGSAGKLEGVTVVVAVTITANVFVADVVEFDDVLTPRRRGAAEANGLAP